MAQTLMVRKVALQLLAPFSCGKPLSGEISPFCHHQQYFEKSGVL